MTVAFPYVQQPVSYATRIATITPTVGASSAVVSGLDSSRGPLILAWEIQVGGTPTSSAFTVAVNALAATYTTYIADNTSISFAARSNSSSSWELAKDATGVNASVKFGGHAIIKATAGTLDRFIDGQTGIGAGGGWQLQRAFSGWLTNADTSVISSLTFALSGGTPTFAAGSRIYIIQI